MKKNIILLAILGSFAWSCSNSQRANDSLAKPSELIDNLDLDSAAFRKKFESVFTTIQDSMSGDCDIYYCALPLKDGAEPYLAVKFGTCAADYLFRLYEHKADGIVACVFETGAGHRFFYRQGNSVLAEACQARWGAYSRIALHNHVFYERKISEYEDCLNESGDDSERVFTFKAEEDEDEKRYSKEEAVDFDWIDY